MEQPVFKTIKCLNFQCYSPEEIKRLSVLEITNLEILDCLGNSAPGGLYDLRLGPNEKDDICETCKLNTFTCAGHPGHITLPVPVYNPVFFPDLYKLLRGSCFSCHRLVAPPVAQLLIQYQLQALDYGLVSTVQDLAEVVTDPSIETVSTDDYLRVIREKLEVKFSEAIKDAKSEERKDPVKSVVECRRGILKNFTRNHMMGATGKCPHCRTAPKKLAKFNLRLVYKDVKSSGSLTSEICNRELTPEEAMKHLQLLWENENTILRHLYKTMYRKDPSDSAPIQMFFMSLLIVPPSRFRRMNMLHGRKYADAQTILYNEILKDNHNIRIIMRKIAKMEISANDKLLIQKIQGKNDSEKYSNACLQLQRHVTELFDSDINKEKNKISKGIKQILEKKEGLFRMNMMGKRVNSAARSVISPDPYIMVNEIGIPMVFAKKLTFPEPVNHANLLNLSRAVMNGPDVHPGASIVEMEDGRRVKLSAEDHVKRQALANQLLTPLSNMNILGGVKIVHRHLKNGDMLLLNRQPTLHKPSIMAHKARVLPGEKTLRLHYSNCKSYNADFDGDEMNCHFPQSYHGQAECRHIVGVNHQYLVPKDGTPLGGLIQDHIIAAVLLTVRGRFFEKEDYHKLIYSAMSFHPKRIILLPPTILKPQMLWSGKQIVSTIIINLIPEGRPPPTLEGKAKVSSKNWKNAPTREWKAGGDPLVGDSMSESEVVIRHGELLCGVIDKAQIGPTPYSLIHICYELYGGETSSTLLTALARLFTHHLQYFAGFSLGIEDIVVNENPNKKRRRILRRAGHAGLVATARAIEVDNPENPDLEELLTKYKEVHFNRDDTGLKMLDMEMKKVTHSLNNDINQVCIPGGLRKKFPQNNLQLMVESGAKGSSVNAMQISCLLGQIELEGRRMPLMKNGSTLPSFLPYDSSPGAGGFVGGRFLTGINPKEYFFHCMAGREGLIDTAVKTSRSGYLQRCLIKHLEGIKVDYDLTVRDSDGTVIQFLYGEDGMDPLKMQMLKKNRLHLLGANYKAAINKSDVEMLKNRQDVNLESIDKEKKKIRKWKKRNTGAKQGRKSLVAEIDYKPGSNYGLKDRLNQIMSATSGIDDDLKKDYERNTRKCPDPVNSKHRPDLAISSICEKLDSIISDYVSDNPHNLIWKDKAHKKKYRLSTEQFKDLCYYRSMRSLAEPGETVGLLAAQSIGEPSTQMTLNTFHFAGKGEMNVTLGIPRIREILMTANTNTPTMDLPLLASISNREQEAERLRLKLAPVALKDVLEEVKVVERRSVPKQDRFAFGIRRTRDYTIRMSFLKHSEYKDYKHTSPSKILYYIEKVFIKKLIEALKKKIKISSSSKLVSILKDNSSGGGFFKSENANNDADEDNPPPPSAKDSKANDEGESSAESEGEGDTTSAKSKRSHNDEQEYDDPEDEEKTPESDDESESEEKMPIVKEEITSSQDEKSEDLDQRQEYRKKYKKKTISDDEKQARITYVQGIQTWVADYDFDTVGERWCEIILKVDLNTISIDMKSLLEEEIAKANIHSVSQIKGAFLVKNEDGKGGPDLMIKTDGVNFLEIFKYVNILDINKVYSNNIQEIAKIYGIEAAANAIKKEIVGVFAAYGIEVDARHLSMVSDYMTCSGFYRPCNRLGMEGQASPLQQMTFETSKNFMVDAMFMGTDDKMRSPSANIITGQMYRGGTGSFDVMVKCGPMN